MKGSIKPVVRAVVRAIGARRWWGDATRPRDDERRTRAIALGLLACATLALGGGFAGDPAPLRHEVAQLKPQTGKLEPRFGRCVALAGKRAVVGSPNEADDGTIAGSAHVFANSKSGWRRVQRLTSSDPQAQDRFGQAVAGDNARIVIGRDCADDAGTDAGAAVVLRRVGNHYAVEATLLPAHPSEAANFGGAIALDGATIVVGAPRDDAVAQEVIQDAGSADVFTFADGAWKPTVTLVAPDAASADWFGGEVAVSGTVIAVGAHGHDQRGDDSGAVYLWRRVHDEWKFDAKVAPDDLSPDDWFGYSCAIDGNLLGVGAPRDDLSGESAGCVRLFRRTDGKWTLEATFRPESGTTSAWFGYSVAVSGARVLVGVPGDSTAGASAGAAILFECQRGSWTMVGTLQPSAPLAGAQFGAAVALGDELAVIGRNWDEDARKQSGSAWIFDLPPPVAPTTTAEPSTLKKKAGDAVTITQRAPEVPRAPARPDTRRRRIVF